MARIYTVSYQGTLTAAGTDCDLFYLKPAADKPIRIRGMRICQFSEVGDAQEENIRISILYLPATVTVGSGGSAVTPASIDQIMTVAAGFTARCNDTTVATTSGTAVTIEELGWNERNTPMELRWLDEREMPIAANAAALVVRNQTTVADDLSIALTAWIEELP